MEDFTTFVCYQLKATMKKVEKYITQEMSQFGLNMAQSFILFTLLEKDGSTLTEIGNRAQIENSSLTTMVDKLEKEGLVERRLYPEDRRVVKLYITPKGRELGEKILAEGSKFNKYLRNNMPGDVEVFFQNLNAISESIDRLNEDKK
ncbi:DNA-binding transcriptional regulator, MarR family [Thermosyntropha lipolytica DSM 11003]|uniref:DNA-binding transcriptional regulator, MarR family n=1 Tax=Thermosyntropha lipolytica DSM 11003 TaxID=1123382 RepID=A0A1M5MVX6_9FIRM|nr:MarR family transcriptional regulator [Thermosyntropha lipolytica]SHG81486.1 DNA-binding transcriptional regulator, MarR family [Thermosyntropha lipolytica DSM 11003]